MRLFFIRICLFLSAIFYLSAEEQMVKVNGLNIWCETFGNREDPALLLIMGSGGQGILWPVSICEKLVQQGFYVIRYDHRDVGYSSTVDYSQNPYDVMDMSRDAVALLDHLKIEKAHLVGGSLGGSIAQLIAAYFPERVHTITLMVTSMEFGNFFDAFEGKPLRNPKLSPPSEHYMAWIHSVVHEPAGTNEERINISLKGWEICNGPDVPFEKEKYKELVTLGFKRQGDPMSSLNHIQALKASLDLIREAHTLVKVPTLVIHGTRDPIVPEDHGRALAGSIPGAKLLLLEGMGHALNFHFEDEIISNIVELCKSVP